MAKLKLAPNNWKLIVNRKLVAKPIPTGQATSPKLQPIFPYLIQTKVPILVAYISSISAKPSWWLASNVQAYLQSGAFVNRSRIGVQQWKIGLNRAALLDFSEHRNASSTYALEFNFPKWHTSIQLEVWEYKNSLEDAYDEAIKQVMLDLARLEKKIDDISEYGRS